MALGTNPLGRVGSAADIAEAVAWLASPASDYVHGHVTDRQRRPDRRHDRLNLASATAAPSVSQKAIHQPGNPIVRTLPL